MEAWAQAPLGLTTADERVPPGRSNAMERYRAVRPTGFADIRAIVKGAGHSERHR